MTRGDRRSKMIHTLWSGHFLLLLGSVATIPNPAAARPEIGYDGAQTSQGQGKPSLLRVSGEVHSDRAGEHLSGPTPSKSTKLFDQDSSISGSHLHHGPCEHSLGAPASPPASLAYGGSSPAPTPPFQPPISNEHLSIEQKGGDHSQPAHHDAVGYSGPQPQTAQGGPSAAGMGVPNIQEVTSTSGDKAGSRSSETPQQVGSSTTTHSPSSSVPRILSVAPIPPGESIFVPIPSSEVVKSSSLEASKESQTGVTKQASGAAPSAGPEQGPTEVDGSRGSETTGPTTSSQPSVYAQLGETSPQTTSSTAGTKADTTASSPLATTTTATQPSSAPGSTPAAQALEYWAFSVADLPPRTSTYAVTSPTSASTTTITGPTQPTTGSTTPSVPSTMAQTTSVGTTDTVETVPSFTTASPWTQTTAAAAQKVNPEGSYGSGVPESTAKSTLKGSPASPETIPTTQSPPTTSTLVAGTTSRISTPLAQPAGEPREAHGRAEKGSSEEGVPSPQASTTYPTQAATKPAGGRVGINLSYESNGAEAASLESATPHQQGADGYSALSGPSSPPPPNTSSSVSPSLADTTTTQKITTQNPTQSTQTASLIASSPGSSSSLSLMVAATNATRAVKTKSQWGIEQANAYDSGLTFAPGFASVEETVTAAKSLATSPTTPSTTTTTTATATTTLPPVTTNGPASTPISSVTVATPTTTTSSTTTQLAQVPASIEASGYDSPPTNLKQRDSLPPGDSSGNPPPLSNLQNLLPGSSNTTANESSVPSSPTTTIKWRPFEMRCADEEDDKGAELCGEWARSGLCESNRPTMFLFCRRTCLCVGPSAESLPTANGTLLSPPPSPSPPPSGTAAPFVNNGATSGTDSGKKKVVVPEKGRAHTQFA